MVELRTIYFCGYFDAPATSKVFSGQGITLESYGSASSADGTDRVGAVFSFDQANVTSRVGISWISSAKACQFVNDEISTNTGIQDLVSASKSIWNSQVFSKIQTTEVRPFSMWLVVNLLSSDQTNTNNLQLLYSMMYGMHILPSNRTGENPLWQSLEPYVGLYIFKSMNPLIS